jgi:hypothetical protein
MMATYLIKRLLDGFPGKSGLRWTCRPGTIVEAPEGEFRALRPGRDYIRLDNRKPKKVKGDG